MSVPEKNLRKPGFIVYLSGLATSALALWAVHLLLEQDVNVMGWYLWYILPAGALLVGIASGLGYAVAARILNVKLSRSFTIGMIVTGLVDYLAAQYLTYDWILEKLHLSAANYDFIQYIRDMCEGMTFTDSRGDTPGTPLGVFGYVFKVLEMAGYAFGAMVPASMVLNMTYCRRCQLYLKPQFTVFQHSPETWSEVKRLKHKEKLAALQQSIQNLIVQVRDVAEQITPGSMADTVAALRMLDPKADTTRVARVALLFKKCPGCEAHEIEGTLTNRAVDGKWAASRVLTVNKADPAVAGAMAPQPEAV